MTLQDLGSTQDALRAYQQAAALGDSLGKSNYDALQEAIRQANARALQPGHDFDPNPLASPEVLRQRTNAQRYMLGHLGATWEEAVNKGNQ